MAAMVATLAVTSSPTLPSPRVAAWSNRAVEVDQGHGQAVDLRARRRRRCRRGSRLASRSAQAWSSSAPKALSRLIIGTWCSTGAKRVETPPTATVGESGTTRSAISSSRARSFPALDEIVRQSPGEIRIAVEDGAVKIYLPLARLH